MVEYRTQEQAFNRKTLPTDSDWIPKQDELVQIATENLYHDNCIIISRSKISTLKICTTFLKCITEHIQNVLFVCWRDQNITGIQEKNLQNNSQ